MIPLTHARDFCPFIKETCNFKCVFHTGKPVSVSNYSVSGVTSCALAIQAFDTETLKNSTNQ